MFSSNVLPLVFASLLCVPAMVAPLNTSVDSVVTRLALAVFGMHIEDTGKRDAARRERLQAAHIDTTYREYTSKTLLYSGLFAIAGSIVGAYVIVNGFGYLTIPMAKIGATLPESLQFLTETRTLTGLTTGERFLLFLASNATVGLVAGVTTYQVRWWLPRHRADIRERRIEESLPNTIAFIYALSRSGMAFPEVMRTLARNQAAYGAAAEEFTVTVKRMDLAGTDMLSAIREMGRKTPSEGLGEFAENLASVLQSGQDTGEFLRDQYERYHEEAASQQEQSLQLLATLAEGYVSLFVVGPLLFITVLMISGLMGLNSTVGILQLITYFGLPLATLGFMVYLDTHTESLRAASVSTDAETDRGGQFPQTALNVHRTEVDGGTSASTATANARRLEAYNRFRDLRRRFKHPVRTLLERPSVLLYVTIPLGLAWVGVRTGSLASQGAVGPETLDDTVVRATLFVLGTFAVVQEVHRRRTEAIEAAVPNFLDRLASVNEAGMTIINSIGRVANSDLGALDVEIERTWADIQWGADVETALHRFDDRIRTATVSRIVTLVTNAMNASGNLAPVLRIAADDAQATRRLKRDRRHETLTYLIIIYISFFVFLVIIGSLNSILVPALNEALQTTGSAPVENSPLPGVSVDPSAVDRHAYSLVVFHAGLIQGVCSGLVAGQMGEGSVKNGVKHATILLAVAYGLFVVLG